MQRKYFIDWVRVLAFFILIFFHCAMPFFTFGWEIKNAEQSVSLSRLIWWLHQWRLPLLFFVSGVGIHFSLAKRSVISFAGERTVRLLIPLLFAMFFVIPLQVYFEKLQEGNITGSYAQFYPQVWTFVPYPEGALHWSHMWFVVYLFVFTILLLPVFALFKIELLDRFKKWLADSLANPFAIVLLLAPMLCCYATLFVQYPEQQSLLNDWFLFIFSITLVVYGYVLAGADKFWDCCEKYRCWFLGIAAVAVVVLFWRYWWSMNLPKQAGTEIYIYGILNSVHIWLLILSALGFAKKHLNFSNSFLQFTNQAVYPFYILHQTIIVAVGFYVVQVHISAVVKFLVLIISTFVGCFIIYRFIIQPFIVPRVLYGLKPKRKKASVQTSAVEAEVEVI